MYQLVYHLQHNMGHHKFTDQLQTKPLISTKIFEIKFSSRVNNTRRENYKFTNSDACPILR